MVLYKNGEKAPFTGSYRWAGHTENVTCRVTHEEYTISLEKDERFPPTRHCEQGAYWEFIG